MIIEMGTRMIIEMTLEERQAVQHALIFAAQAFLSLPASCAPDPTDAEKIKINWSSVYKFIEKIDTTIPPAYRLPIKNI